MPTDPFSAFTNSAFRLETLPQYLVDVETARFTAFRECRALPEWPADSVAWFEGIAAQVAGGKLWRRVHVVDRPLSDYTRFELRCYEDNVRAGEDVRIAERAWHAGLADLHEDFWLFDAETDHPLALLMQYDAEGHWLGYWKTMDPGVIAECGRRRDLALQAAVSLAEFAATAGGQ
jgi:hypothetical protein